MDKLGDLDDAVASAASLAKLEKYDVINIQEKRTPLQMFLGNASARIAAWAGFGKKSNKTAHASLRKVVKEAENQVECF